MVARMLSARLVVAFVVATVVAFSSARGSDRKSAESSGPERRALGFLSKEVAQWPAENKCFSCHNNGDAVRALYRAASMQYPVVRASVAETTEFLANPSQWKENGVDADFSDKQLASIQFGNALAEACATGFVQGPKPLIEAAKLIVEFQQPEGYWSVADQGIVGSPAAYGRALATVTSVRILRQADSARFEGPIARADQWLRKVKPKSILDAAAVLHGLADANDAAAVDQRRRCLTMIEAGQGRDGGWGPFEISPAEPFDTAIVLLALAKLPATPERDKMLRGGRQFLVESQLDDGSWLETTRPAGGQSYAQRISTTGWAALALLMTANAGAGTR